MGHGTWDIKGFNRLRHNGLMKELFSFVLGLLLFLYPFADQAEENEVPEPISKDALNYLLSEDMYQGAFSWQGNKVSTKFNYDMKKEKNK